MGMPMKHDYEINVNCKYGAPMGRMSSGCFADDGKIHLTKVPIDSGGYDKGGAYWGTAYNGLHLYCAEGIDDDGNAVVKYFRAYRRESAKQYVRDYYHAYARFYR